MAVTPARADWRVFFLSLTIGCVVLAVVAAVVDLFEWRSTVFGIRVAPMVFVLLLFVNTAVAGRLSARKAPHP